MGKKNPTALALSTVSLLKRPLKVNLKGLFVSASKALIHLATVQWEKLACDAVDALAAIGSEQDAPSALAILIHRAVAKAIFDLVGDMPPEVFRKISSDAKTVAKNADFAVAVTGVEIEKKFFEAPSRLSLVRDVSELLAEWLVAHEVPPAAARAIVGRFPSYFVYALNHEWRSNAKYYRPIVDALDTPFTRAGEREWSWQCYAALLERRIHEGVFDESFSLAQLYTKLNAYYVEERAPHAEFSSRRMRIVVSLEDELDRWLEKPTTHDAIRVVSGGPGSGKSSFARIYAARIAQEGQTRVLFVPLHLIDASKDLVEEVGRFVRDEGVLISNPLDPDHGESNLLVIFDGLDELASQGKAAAETARAFVREVERTVQKRNLHSVRLRVILSGRELVVQENESEFRRPRQILTLLPYCLPIRRAGEPRRYLAGDGEDGYEDSPLLRADARQTWWKNYGKLTGRDYKGLPRELARPDLDEVTAQPLLNYLVALSYTREKIDFAKNINLNTIYEDLVGAVHERGYEKHRAYGPIRHMSLADFSRVLEEIGLAAWHGDGRTTTVREIEDHCRASGVGRLLDVFQEGAKSGVTRLLAAFFFRQHGQRPSGDPTFVFTHKSFGEYLAARRVVRAVERVVQERERHRSDPDAGWDEKEALRHWAQICGPSAISIYLHPYLIREIQLRTISEVGRWQKCLSDLFGCMLRFGLPMELIKGSSYKEAAFQARNAEESLLVAMNSCARVTGAQSKVEIADPTAFGAWFRRVQGQRTSPENPLAAECLSHLDMPDLVFDIADLYLANLSGSNLPGLRVHYACLANANLGKSTLSRLRSERANFENANLEGTDLSHAWLVNASFQGANLENANLDRADLRGADFRGANLTNCSMNDADTRGAVMKGSPSNTALRAAQRATPRARRALDEA